MDRVLDIRIWSPNRSKRSKTKKQAKSRSVPEILVDSDEASSGAEDELHQAFLNGEEPSAAYIETIDEYESRTNREVTEEDIGKVVWAFIKWDDLAYDECAY